jgi:hypothetical protein
MSTYTDWAVRYINADGVQRERSFPTQAARTRWLTAAQHTGACSQVLAFADATDDISTRPAYVRPNGAGWFIIDIYSTTGGFLATKRVRSQAAVGRILGEWNAHRIDSPATTTTPVGDPS